MTLNRIQEQQILQLYSEGMARDKIAEHMSISSGSVGYTLKKKKVQMRPRGFQIGNKLGCRFILGTQIRLYCLHCSVEFCVPPCLVKLPNVRKYCSKRCYHVHRGILMRGAGHPNWKGGISTKWDILHRSREYQEWRLAVYKRDRFECKNCGQKQNRANPLHAHHIRPKKEFPELVLDINNGKTLCRACHISEHKSHNRRHR